MTPAQDAATSASPANAPNPLILATVEHLARFAPFDGMAREHLIWLAERLEVGYFAKGEILLEPEQGEVDRLFIIKQGIVQGEREGSGAWLELHEGESFPLGALLSYRPAISTFRAKGDVFTYELSAADFHALLKLSPEYHDFCTRRIAALLAKSQQSRTHLVFESVWEDWDDLESHRGSSISEDKVLAEFKPHVEMQDLTVRVYEEVS